MTPAQAERLLLELAAQAQATSWADRRACERAQILQTLMKQSGWVWADRYSARATTAAWMIAMHAPTPRWLSLQVQVLGCLLAECNTMSSVPTERRWWQRSRPVMHDLSEQLLSRQRAAKLIDQILLNLGAPVAFATARPQLLRGRLIDAPICLPTSEVERLRDAIGLSLP